MFLCVTIPCIEITLHTLSTNNGIVRFPRLKETLLSLEPGTAPGSGGLRPEFLIALGERMEAEELALLEEFGLAYTSGELPPWLYRLWLSMQTVPLYKTAEKEDVRPLGIRHSLPRLFHREVMRPQRGSQSVLTVIPS